MPDTIPRIIQIGRADPPAGLGLFQKTIGIGTDLTILKRPWHRPWPTSAPLELVDGRTFNGLFF